LQNQAGHRTHARSVGQFRKFEKRAQAETTEHFGDGSTRQAAGNPTVDNDLPMRGLEKLLCSPEKLPGPE
jgi:hypothetical protein